MILTTSWMVSGVLAVMILIHHFTKDTWRGMAEVPFELIFLGIILGKIMLFLTILYLIADYCGDI